MNKIRIPKRFQLYGQTIEVEFNKKLQSSEDAVGQAIFSENKIVLQPNIAGVHRRQELIEQAYLHELTHFIFAAMESDLFQNEKFVEHFSQLLHQALKTSQYK